MKSVIYHSPYHFLIALASYVITIFCSIVDFGNLHLIYMMKKVGQLKKLWRELKITDITDLTDFFNPKAKPITTGAANERVYRST